MQLVVVRLWLCFVISHGSQSQDLFKLSCLCGCNWSLLGTAPSNKHRLFNLGFLIGQYLSTLFCCVVDRHKTVVRSCDPSGVFMSGVVFALLRGALFPSRDWCESACLTRVLQSAAFQHVFAGLVFIYSWFRCWLFVPDFTLFCYFHSCLTFYISSFVLLKNILLQATCL